MAFDQLAFDQLEDEVSGCRMRRPPVLKRPCWRLVSDELWTRGKASQCKRLPEVVGDDVEQQPNLKPMTGEPGPVGGGLPSLIH